MWVLLLSAAALNLCGITWGLPNSEDWAIDSITPRGPLYYAQQMVSTGHWWAKYPPLHFTIMAVLYAPYVAFLLLTGALDLGGEVAEFPHGFLRPEFSLSLFILTGRVVSASMGVGTAVAAYFIGRELAGRQAGLFAGLLFASSPLAVYYSHTGNLDIPYMFWSSLALLCLVRVARGAPTGTYVRLGVFVAAAIATKDQAYGMFLLLPLPLLAMHWRRDGVRALGDRRLLIGLAAAVLAYLLAANVLLDFPGWLRHVRHITHEGSAPYRIFPATPAGYLGLAGRTLRFVVEALSGPALLVAVGGLVWALARRTAGAGVLAFAAVSYAVTFLGVVGYVLPRFVLPVVFVLAVFAGMASGALWNTRRLAARAVVVAVVAYAMARGVSMDLGLLWDSRYAAERWMASHLPSASVVGTTGEPTYLPRFPPGVTTVSITMTPAGPVAEGDPPEYLVLSDAHYKRYLRREAFRPAMNSLLAGELGYETVAVFQQQRLPVTGLIPTLNPRIVVLRRRPEAERLSGGTWR